MEDTECHGYSERFTRALEKAHSLHQDQFKKGTSIPYISHLLAVAAIVIESGGCEDEAIAALLHDGPEDVGGLETLQEIRSEFGDGVAEIVEHCSDTFDRPKPEWWARKRDYHARLRSASSSALLVSVADKVNNAERTAEDLRTSGLGVWSRFKAGRAGSLWNYANLLEIYREKASPSSVELVNRFERAVDSLVETEREKVLARFVDPSSLPLAGPPKLRIVSGGVCTGKSRFIREQLSSGYVHLDAPRIFLAMCRDQVLDFPGELEERLEETGRAVARRAVEARRNIVVEVIGQDEQRLSRMIRQLAECGYRIRSDALECDVDQALARNEERGENNISAYFSEDFHLKWLVEAGAECSTAKG